MLNTLIRCESVALINQSSSHSVMWTDILNCCPRAVQQIKAKSYHRLMLTAATSKLPYSDAPCKFSSLHAARCDNVMRTSGLEKICVQSSICTNRARAEAIPSHHCTHILRVPRASHVTVQWRRALCYSDPCAQNIYSLSIKLRIA